jgi:hypothetical protein
VTVPFVPPVQNMIIRIISKQDYYVLDKESTKYWTDNLLYQSKVRINWKVPELVGLASG